MIDNHGRIRDPYTNPDTEKAFIDMMHTMEKVSDKMDELLLALYETKISTMDDEELGYEFADNFKEPDEYFDWLMANRGRQHVEERLVDNFGYNLMG